MARERVEGKRRPMGSILRQWLTRSPARPLAFLLVAYSIADVVYTYMWYRRLFDEPGDPAPIKYFIDDPLLFLLAACLLFASFSYRHARYGRREARKTWLGLMRLPAHPAVRRFVGRALPLAAAIAFVVVILHGYRDYQDAVMRSAGDRARQPLEGMGALFDHWWGHWRECVMRVGVAAIGALLAAVLAV
jgi:hypothetical protein